MTVNLDFQEEDEETGDDEESSEEASIPAKSNEAEAVPESVAPEKEKTESEEESDNKGDALKEQDGKTNTESTSAKEPLPSAVPLEARTPFLLRYEVTFSDSLRKRQQ